MKALRPLVLAAIALTLPLAAAAQDAKPAVTFAPYAMIHFGNYWSGGSLAAQDYPGQAVLTAPVSSGSFHQSARASRVGVRGAIDDGNFTGATLTGFIEFDFYGGHQPGNPTATTTCDTASPPVCTTAVTQGTAVSTGFNAALMRLRFASMTASWKIPTGTVSLLAGQDWSIVNGLFAESLGYYAVPLFHNAGNLYRRGPTMRLAYNGNFDIVQVSVAAEAMNAVSGMAGAVDNGPGNRSRTPDVAARIGVTVKPMADISVAVAGSYGMGKRRFNYNAATQKDVEVNVVGAEVDANLTKYLQVKGEFYSTDGMDDAYAGIAPAASIIGTAAQNYDGYRGTGYWGQAILKPLPEVFLTAGLGVGEVNKSDLETRLSTGQASVRQKNQIMTGGVLFNAGKNWRFGLEYSQNTSTYGDFDGVAKNEKKATQIALSSWVKF